MEVAREHFKEFRYPKKMVMDAIHAVKHNKNKILSDKFRGDSLAAAMDADFAVGWILKGLSFLYDVPNTESSRNLNCVLNSDCVDDVFKETLVSSIVGTCGERIEAAVKLSDMFLEMADRALKA